MKDKQQLLARVIPETEKIDGAMRRDIEQVPDALLREILVYSLFNGGKRIRPLLCVLAGRLCGSTTTEIYRLAMAFEYLHVATLLHDDIIDQADRRRGKAAVASRWGATPAILAGDYLHARSMHLIGCLGGPRCLEVICRVTAAMVEGEFLQLQNLRDMNQSEADYFAVIKGKTALLLGAVCEIGALYAAGNDQQVKALADYGTELGIGFQLVDDLLDYQGDPAQTGKATGNDLAEGKMTLPLIRALATTSIDERKQLLALLTGEPSQRVEALPIILEIIERENGFRYTREKAAEHLARAVYCLEPFAGGPHAEEREILTGLAQYILAREK